MRRNVLIFSILFLLVLPLSFATTIDQNVIEAIAEDGQAKVIIVLKDSNDVINSEILESVDELEDFKEDVQELQENILEDLILKEEVDNSTILESSNSLFSSSNTQKEITVDDYDFELKHQFELVAALSGNITEDGLDKLNNPNVETIYLDREVNSMLSQSRSHHNVTDVHSLAFNGMNITGSGQSVCVLDTGINYAHSALSDCDLINITTTGIIENLSVPVESAHNYSNNLELTFTINKTGYTSIAVHFVNISLENLISVDATDRVIVKNGNNETVAVYKNDLVDVWSPSVDGDTIYVTLISDPVATDYGFYIDQVINGTTNSTADYTQCPRLIDGWDFVNTDNDPFDDNGHGTHVSGTISSNDSTYRGIAPDSNILGMKVLNSAGSGWMSDVAAAIDWCTANQDRYNISVITMSLGTTAFHSSSSCDGSEPVGSIAVNSANSAGITVIAASGNEAQTSGISSPACLANVISVGSVNSGDAVAGSSNSGSNLDILARGVSIVSTEGSSGTTCGAPGNGFGSCSGTSMATPHFAGAVALLSQYWEVAYNKSITPAQVLRKFSITGRLVNDSKNSLVRPRFDMLAAIQPFVNHTSNSTTNGSFVIKRDVYVEITSDVSLSTAQIEWNYSNGTLVNLTMNAFNTSKFNLNITELETGVHSYTVLGNDSLNTFGSSSTYTITIDNIIPNQSVFVNPTNGINLSSGNLNLNATVSDGNSLIDTVLLNITNGSSPFTVTLSPNTLPNFSSIINLSTIAEGEHTITIIANDSLGNINSTTTINITVDRTAPNLTLFSPVNNSSIHINATNNTFTLNYNITDALSSVSNCSLYLNNSLNQTDNSVIENSIEAFNITLNAGDYSWFMSCTDFSNNIINSSVNYFNVTSVVPIVTLVTPVNVFNTSNSTVLFNCSIFDDVSVSNVTLYGNFSGTFAANETVLTNSSSAVVTFTKNLTDNNHYNWNCKSTDTGGNSAFAPLNYTLIIDSTFPNITNVSSGSVSQTSAVISWFISEGSNGSVSYGTTSSLGSDESSTTFSTSKSVTLSGLSAGTTYYYNVTSCDFSGNCNSTGPATFATTAASSSGGGGGGSSGGGSSRAITTTVTTTDTTTDAVEDTAVAEEVTTEDASEPEQTWSESDKLSDKLMETFESKFGLSEVKQAASVEAFKEENFLINDPLIAISELSIVMNNDVAFEISVESIPSPEVRPDVISYQAFEVNLGEVPKEDIEEGVFSFVVEKDFIDFNNARANQIVLQRFSNDRWERLPTELSSDVNADGDYVYTAITPGFSLFEITIVKDSYLLMAIILTTFVLIFVICTVIYLRFKKKQIN